MISKCANNKTAGFLSISLNLTASFFHRSQRSTAYRQADIEALEPSPLELANRGPFGEASKAIMLLSKFKPCFSGGHVRTTLTRRSSRIGSGTVIVSGVLIALFVLLCLGRLVGWDPTWRTSGVTPLQPPFFDMHVVMDYAVCASQGFDAYIPHSCNPANFNIPPIWLGLGFLGLNGSYSAWLSVTIIAAAFGVMVALLKGRSVADGALALMALLSPSVMMGVERGNLDLLILALVGGAALIYQEQRIGRMCGTIALMGLAIVLKLFPMFSVALAARFNRRTFLFAGLIALFSLAYLAAISEYIPLIRHNVPTTFILSYGYKALFLGLDHLRTEAGLNPIGLADTWVPILVSILTVIFAAVAALMNFHYGRMLCTVTDSVAGTAFLIGSGIYCGTFLLGTNFIYRLMFLLLCLPQLQDWQSQKLEGKERSATIERGLFATVLSVLWLNGNSNGNSIFLLVPQLLDWLLFFGLAAVLMSNFLNSATSASKRLVT